ncbi:hypothetical protein BC831DRAFT_90695 [Entophlyctis helioformis]|nr:hypothetical protein BC831DRAFT_90695 [Entophlyctis helioformis]
MSAPADCAVLTKAFPAAFAAFNDCCYFTTGRSTKVSCRDGRITNIKMDGVGLTGSLPESIGSLTELRFLTLSNNQLTGAGFLVTSTFQATLSPDPSPSSMLQPVYTD